jgi:hypothetical protein
MDPRVWESLAIALGESVVDSKKQGVFVDIQLLPSGEKYTARIGSDYAGPGYGFYAGKIHKDDELVVSCPSGNAAEGHVVVKRVWNGADLVPPEVASAPDDIVLVVEKDKNLNIHVQGKGKVTTLYEGDYQGEVDGATTLTHKGDVEDTANGAYKVVCADIRLGDKNPSDYAALAQKVLDELTKVKTDLAAVKSTFDSHVHILTISAQSGAGGTGTAAAPAAPIPDPHSPASVACTTTKVK